METKWRNYAFDLYGTLVDIRTDEDSARLWVPFARYWAYLGMKTTPAALKAIYARRCAAETEETERRLMEKGVEGPGEIDIRQVWRTMAWDTGGHLTYAQTQDVSRVFRSLSIRRLRLYPGAAEVLAALRAAGKRLALLTNAQETFTRGELYILGIASAFDHVFISSEAGVKKPSPAFFGLLSQAGMDPQETVMIGNDGLCDCWGAEDAGMDSVYIHTDQSPPRSAVLPSRCVEIDSLKRLLE